MWDKIKHALNSTLGTPDFKPLNEIIMQEKDLAASDYVYKVVRPAGTGSMLNDFSFTANRNGSVRILYWHDGNKSSSYLKIFTVSVKKGETVVVQDEHTVYYDTKKPDFFGVDVPITKGDTYTVSTRSRGSASTVITEEAIGAVELDVTGISIN